MTIEACTPKKAGFFGWNPRVDKVYNQSAIVSKNKMKIAEHAIKYQKKKRGEPKRPTRAQSTRQTTRQNTPTSPTDKHGNGKRDRASGSAAQRQGHSPAKRKAQPREPKSTTRPPHPPERSGPQASTRDDVRCPGSDPPVWTVCPWVWHWVCAYDPLSRPSC